MIEDKESTSNIIQSMCDQLNEKGFESLVLGTSTQYDDSHICSGSLLGIKFLTYRADIVDDFLAYIKENCLITEEAEDGNNTAEDEVTIEADTVYNDTDINNSTDVDIRTEVTIINGLSSDVLLYDTACHVCGKNFKSGRALSGHMKAHNMEKPTRMSKNHKLEAGLKYRCEKCGEAFEFEALLKMHKNRTLSCINKDVMIRASIEEELIVFTNNNQGNQKLSLSDALSRCKHSGIQKCFICSYTSKVPSNMRRHIIAKHTEDAPYKCNYCSKTFKLDDVLSKHIMRVHCDKEFMSVVCHQCQGKFESEERLNIHMKFKCPKRAVNHKCELCGYTPKTASSLANHMRTHRGDKPFNCEQCGKLFSRQENLNSHMDAMHSENTEFKCDICGMKFVSKYKCRRHIKTHNAPEYRCDICVKSFASAANLKAHALIHANLKHLTCHVCGKGFRWKKCLEQHMLIHTGEKPFACETCGNKFRCKTTLLQHMESHTGDKHICDVCGRSFVQKGKMNYHRKSHFITHRFKCKFCDTKFKSVTSLKSHMIKLHPEKQKEIELETNYKLHECNYENCVRFFSTKDNLNSHIRSMHINAKPFKCTFCSKRFNYKCNKTRHEKSHRFKKDRKVTCSICDKILTPQEFSTHAIKCRKQKHESKSSSKRNIGFSVAETESYRSVKGLEFVEQQGGEELEELENVLVKVICGTCGKQFTHKEINNHVKECHKQMLNSQDTLLGHTKYACNKNHQGEGKLQEVPVTMNKVNTINSYQLMSQTVQTNDVSNYNSVATDALCTSIGVELYLPPSTPSAGDGKHDFISDSTKHTLATSVGEGQHCHPTIPTQNSSTILATPTSVPGNTQRSMAYNLTSAFIGKIHENQSNFVALARQEPATEAGNAYMHLQNHSIANSAQMFEGQLINMTAMFPNAVADRDTIEGRFTEEINVGEIENQSPLIITSRPL